MGIGYEDDPVQPEVEPAPEQPAPAAPVPDPIAEAVSAARRAAEAAAAWSQYAAQTRPTYEQPVAEEIAPPEDMSPEMAQYVERKMEERLGQYFDRFGQMYERDRFQDASYKDSLELERARASLPGFQELEPDIAQLVGQVPVAQRANPDFYKMAYHAALGARVAASIAERNRQAPPIATGVSNVPAQGGGFSPDERRELQDRFSLDSRDAELLSNRVVDVDEFLAAKAARKR